MRGKLRVLRRMRCKLAAAILIRVRGASLRSHARAEISRYVPLYVIFSGCRKIRREKDYSQTIGGEYGMWLISDVRHPE